MAGRATYTEQDMATVYVTLMTNEGNVKRTARETGMPESTVRRWRDEWEKNGPPRMEEVEAAIGNFLEATERVRNKALLEIERQIEAGELKNAALVTAFGVLTDKIDRAKGIGSRVEHEHRLALPSHEELASLMVGAVEAAKIAARERDEEIIDAEVIEQPALPAGRQ